MKIGKSKMLVTLALFVAIGLVLQYIEGYIVISPIPGGKLGLCNIVSILNIFMFGGRSALIAAAVRSFLGAALFGGAMTIPYSMAGAIFSTIAMCCIKNYIYPKAGFVGISIVGAVANNIAQMLVAVVFYRTMYVLSYLPVLLICALVSGFITGIATFVAAKRLLKEF